MISNDLYLYYTYCFCYIYNASNLPVEKRKDYLILFCNTFGDNLYAKNRLLETISINHRNWTNDIDSYISYTLIEPNPQYVCYMCILCVLLARFYAKGNFNIAIVNGVDKYIRALSNTTLTDAQVMQTVTNFKNALFGLIKNASGQAPISKFTTDLYNIYWWFTGNNVPLQ